jgi:predicted acylesterase/phospholipase RssA
MKPPSIKARLAQTRETFRARMEAEGAREVWNRFGGRIGAVLAGGGARGAYEAGALLAFQDAGMPTHVIAGASIGGINAASFAANSHGLVGNAEHLIRTWLRLTPLAVGIDWSRYIWKLVGLIALSAGLGNLLLTVLELHGVHLNLLHPVFTWGLLASAGLWVMLFYDSLPYFGYLLRNQLDRTALRRAGFSPQRGKALTSLGANVLVWGSLAALLVSVGVLQFVAELMHPAVAVAAIVAIGGSVGLRVFAPRVLQTALHKFLRAPFRRGLFNNFNRTRLLRRAISERKLRESPIRVVFPAADVNEGPAVFFSNAQPSDLASDPGADRAFAEEVSSPHDLILALAATSAVPLAFEPIRYRGRLLADGGLAANQPIRPALRLGADVVFLVLMEPLAARRQTVRTFLDMGLRALNMLLLQTFLTDRKTLEGINDICAVAAQSLGLRPEEVEVDVGTRRYRYVKAFTISPQRPLDAGRLDFGGAATARAILQGYRDATRSVEEFLQYARESRHGAPKRALRLQAVAE